MVNRPKVEGIIRKLREYTEHLRQLANLDEAKFLPDPMTTAAAKYYLLVSIEACIDIANHLISAERLRAPQDYRDTFKVLNESGILTADFTQRLQDMAGFRNRLVHLYWEIDDQRVHSILVNELSDFDEYVQCILQYIGAED